ncbi:hypothetical protein BCR41DRAFT_373541 [Lobosporangium transversale]|uniref:Uncharacterized protein n=1 Tax=Lobosporangium transversale TaxID=64571 RepID=A0A1Y2GF72_9FUNG|nr:hypothetical protein BCR41DRAFT_373541 [Lobosporangium transversale]ORZ07783.1 hypothetical protein BCR41DRAFT_373541 [Lobosporangium transversale]|eukprot:XP_021878149.1 hypothetical protein BCR41DRAFT_373541 [Lobosporangium transversale]
MDWRKSWIEQRYRPTSRRNTVKCVISGSMVNLLANRSAQVISLKSVIQLTKWVPLDDEELNEDPSLTIASLHQPRVSFSAVSRDALQQADYTLKFMHYEPEAYDSLERLSLWKCVDMFTSIASLHPTCQCGRMVSSNVKGYVRRQELQSHEALTKHINDCILKIDASMSRDGSVKPIEILSSRIEVNL